MDNRFLCARCALGHPLHSFHAYKLTEILKNKWIWIVAAFGLLLFYYLADPLQSRWMPQCVFHKVTGWQCMGCGSQRMIYALLHGNFLAAIKANAFIFFSIPFLIFLFFLELNRLRYPQLYRRVHSSWVMAGIAAALFLWFIFRNILGI